MKTAGIFPDPESSGNWKIAMDIMIDEKLILQVGKEKEIGITEREIDKAVERIRKRMGVEQEEFNKLLVREGLTMERYRQTMEDQLMAGKVLAREVRSQVQLTDEDIAEYYEKQKNEFKVKPKMRVRHIILIVKNEASDEEAKKALKRITQIRGEIIGGLDFGDAAKKYSQGPSATSGGLLNEVSQGEMVKKFEDAAFALEPGEISGPVRTRFGYHLIKMESKTTSKFLPMDEVRPKIENKIYQKLVMEVQEDWLNSVKKEAFIDIKMEVD
ncbi:MAG: hypothetical protein IEMM0002_1334 [bacterium]|nr:MAG: hypothetical protein IEMM0002_1334 [bacterium]